MIKVDKIKIGILLRVSSKPQEDDGNGLDIQKEYMGKSFYLGGGKTGIARRIGWDEPSLTLTCSPAQKQTERCHPDESRPFTVREYARIQTFPDSIEFLGNHGQQCKQVGKAFPPMPAELFANAIRKAIVNDWKEENLSGLVHYSLVEKNK